MLTMSSTGAAGRGARAGQALVACGVMAWIAAVACRIIPGVDPIIAVGPIASALNDAAVGGLAGGLIDFGVPQMQARRYEDKIKKGHILVSVHTENPVRSEKARKIFSAAGAEDLCMMTGVTSSMPVSNC